MSKYLRIINLTNKINSSISFKELIGSIIDAGKELLDAEGASLLLMDADPDELIFDVVVSDKGEIIQGKKIRIGTGIAGHAAKTGKPVISNDVSKDERFYSAIDIDSGFVTRSVVAVPVRTKNKLVGVLEVVNSFRDEGFTEDDADMLSHIADAAALAIQNNELVTSLRNRVNELTCIYEISQSIYFSDDIEQLLGKVIGAIERVIRARRCSFIILEDDSETIRHFVSNAAIGGNRPADIKNTLMGHVARSGDPLLVYNLADDPKFAARLNMSNYRTNSFICIPMKIQDKVIGILNVTDKPDGEPFDSFDLRVLSTISQQVAAMYENILHYRAELERRRIEHDLEIAAEIQRQALTNIPGDIKGATVGGFIHPARYVGGDFYEISEIGDRFICAAMGDISGKGIPAAIFLSTVRNVLRNEMLKSVSPENLIPRINMLVFNESYNGMFCTFFYALIDKRDHLIHYSSAGHNPQLYYASDTDTFFELTTSGKPLGIFNDTVFGCKSIPYEKGDLLILFTDGLVEHGNYGAIAMEDLQSLVRANRSLTGETISDKVREFAKKKNEGKETLDDSTFLVISLL
jgi:serine phosphatase RsbU (regulator of sigma subunit)/putative methionine-R-sulfoxide reductase with GAF domain